MRTAPAVKRSGIASLLLAHIISEAAASGYERISLETGSVPFFKPARKLYEKFGFQYCLPFDNYIEDPFSVFMEKILIS